jgi:pyridoxine kinase
MKRVLSIQDISCVGKCSLTVALPIISAAGIECAILPTAVLSTHTAFKGFTFRDLTEDLDGIADHWKQEKIVYDGIATGYLGSFRQIEQVERIFSMFDHDKMLKFVDPAMGDKGKLYPGFTPEFAKRMGGLCGKADIIVPNLTEASFMLGIPYKTDYKENDVKDILKKLADLGAKYNVLTGISLKAGELGVMAYDSEKNEFFYYANEHLPYNFHGTGDVFASSCCGALTSGFSYQDALKIATDFTVESMKKTIAEKEHIWYGVDFEAALPYLIRRIGK